MGDEAGSVNTTTQVQKTADNTIAFSISQKSVGISGSVTVNVQKDGLVELTVNTNRQQATLRGRPGGDDAERVGTISLSTAQSDLAAQVGPLTDPVTRIADTEMLANSMQKDNCTPCLYLHQVAQQKSKTTRNWNANDRFQIDHT